MGRTLTEIERSGRGQVNAIEPILRALFGADRKYVGAEREALRANYDAAAAERDRGAGLATASPGRHSGDSRLWSATNTASGTPSPGRRQTYDAGTRPDDPAAGPKFRCDAGGGIPNFVEFRLDPLPGNQDDIYLRATFRLEPLPPQLNGRELSIALRRVALHMSTGGSFKPRPNTSLGESENPLSIPKPIAMGIRLKSQREACCRKSR